MAHNIYSRDNKSEIFPTNKPFVVLRRPVDHKYCLPFCDVDILGSQHNKENTLLPKLISLDKHSLYNDKGSQVFATLNGSLSVSEPSLWTHDIETFDQHEQLTSLKEHNQKNPSHGQSSWSCDQDNPPFPPEDDLHLSDHIYCMPHDVTISQQEVFEHVEVLGESHGQSSWSSDQDNPQIPPEDDLHLSDHIYVKSRDQMISHQEYSEHLCESHGQSLLPCDQDNPPIPSEEDLHLFDHIYCMPHDETISQQEYFKHVDRDHSYCSSLSKHLVRMEGIQQKKPAMEGIQRKKPAVEGIQRKKTAELTDHIYTDSLGGSGPQVYNCFDCKKEFHNKMHYIEHLKENQSCGKGYLKCNECNLVFHNQNTLREHLKVHFGQTLTFINLKKHSYTPRASATRSSEPVEFKCPDCNQIFDSKKILSEHMKEHFGEQLNWCYICKKSLHYKGHLLTHMKRRHWEKRAKPTCSVCDKPCQSTVAVEKHMKRMHNQGMNTSKSHWTSNKCDTCGRTFKTYASLKCHRKIYNKTLQCDRCGKTFRNRNTLKMHIMSVHTMERNHVCEVCGKRFLTKYALKAHNKIHTVTEETFQCNQCDRKYSSKQKLRTHIMRSHAMVRNHGCEICGKRFFTNNWKTIHMRIHTGERPYSCEICDKAFSSKGSLNLHMKSTSHQRRQREKSTREVSHM